MFGYSDRRMIGILPVLTEESICQIITLNLSGTTPPFDSWNCLYDPKRLALLSSPLSHDRPTGGFGMMAWLEYDANSMKLGTLLYKGAHTPSVCLRSLLRVTSCLSD